MSEQSVAEQALPLPSALLSATHSQPTNSNSDLGPGDIRYLEALGRELVVWRSEDGPSMHAITAFCPHQGANLAHGRVKGDRLVCPFHQWEMTGEG